MEDRWRPIKAIRNGKIKPTHTRKYFYLWKLNLWIDIRDTRRLETSQGPRVRAGSPADPVSVARKTRAPSLSVSVRVWCCDVTWHVTPRHVTLVTRGGCVTGQTSELSDRYHSQNDTWDEIIDRYGWWFKVIVYSYKFKISLLLHK